MMETEQTTLDDVDYGKLEEMFGEDYLIEYSTHTLETLEETFGYLDDSLKVRLERGSIHGIRIC